MWDLARTFVAVPSPGETRIMGYYTLSMSDIDVSVLEDRLGMSFVPAVLLGRIAVDLAFQGRRLGEYLLLDALARARRVAESDIGAYAVFVETPDEETRGFYLRYGFEQLLDSPRHLFITMSRIEPLGLRAAA